MRNKSVATTLNIYDRRNHKLQFPLKNWTALVEIHPKKKSISVYDLNIFLYFMFYTLLCMIYFPTLRLFSPIPMLLLGMC